MSPAYDRNFERYLSRISRKSGLYAKLSEFIAGNLTEEFPNSNINQFALNHENVAVNFLYLAANWYVGRKTQKCKDLFWDEFLKHIKILLDGEKTAIVNRLVNKL